MFDESTENHPKPTPIFGSLYTDSTKIWKGLFAPDSAWILFKVCPHRSKSGKRR